MLDVYSILAYIFLCIDWLLFLMAISKAIKVFPNKNRRFFILLVLGLCNSILFAMTQTAVFQFGVSNLLLLTLGAVFWFLMIVCCNFVYSARIQSLGGYFRLEKLVKWTPYIFIVVLTPIVILAECAAFIKIDATTKIMTLAGLVLGVTLIVFIAVGEVFLHMALLNRVFEILEYRGQVKRRLMVELGLSMVVLVILEIILLVSRLLSNNMDTILRPFTYLLR